jgi:DNA-binding GntR family transcriptional regulator
VNARPIRKKKRAEKRAPLAAKRAKDSSGTAAGDAEVPLYRKVVRVLKDEILKGVYPVGTQLPTEGELSDRFDVSRHTVREALRQLRDDGLVSSRRGAGTTVRRSSTPQPYVHEIASIDDLVAYASGTQYRAESSAIVVADAALAERLGGSPGQRWLRIEGFRYTSPDQTVPICWTEVFVHAAYAGVGLLLGRRPGPIYGWIEDQYGERIIEVEQVLRARPVPREIAPTLQVEPDSTVIEVRRTFRIASGTTAEISFNLYPAERFSFSMTLRRARG